MADLNITIASVFAGKKAFADAAKQTLSLNSQVKNLAKDYLQFRNWLAVLLMRLKPSQKMTRQPEYLADL